MKKSPIISSAFINLFCNFPTWKAVQIISSHMYKQWRIKNPAAMSINLCHYVQLCTVQLASTLLWLVNSRSINKRLEMYVTITLQLLTESDQRDGTLDRVNNVGLCMHESCMPRKKKKKESLTVSPENMLQIACI